MGEIKDREAWNKAVETTGKILRETIKDALDSLDPAGFLTWVKGFVGYDEAKPEKGK